LPPLTALIEQWINWRPLDVHLERVADIALTNREPGIDAPTQNRAMKGRIDLVDVRFRYALHEPEILRGVSMTIQPGEYVAITGPSGSGKSTLLKVLTGLYQPTSGAVLFDGLPAHAWGPRAIREQLGVVMQDDTLMAGSIAENIAMFDEHIDMERVVGAARLACIHDHIERMPMGYRSLVGDMGSTLSGGQQQRVMIARALYRNPQILVLDEGTSHLDVDTEKAVNAALSALAITRIVVAHRPETIRSASRVLLLNNGQLAPQAGLYSQQNLR
jgi:ATP-binding cassette subfamily B protein RaxB